MAFNFGKFLARLIGRRRSTPSTNPNTTPPAPLARYLSVSVRDADGRGVQGATVSFEPDNTIYRAAMTTDGNGRASFNVPAVVTGGAWVKVRAEGFKDGEQRYDGIAPGSLPLPQTDSELTPPWVILDRSVRRRHGATHLDGRRFVDDDGAYLAVGASLFWAVWGYRNDPGKLVANLLALDGRTDYVRIIACVDGKSWEDRATTADAIFGSDCIAGTADACFAHGQRAHWTIFGGSPVTASSASIREAVVRRVCEQLAPRLHTVQFVEIANEENDFKFAGGRDEMIRLANIVRQMLPGVEVALTSPLDGSFVAFNDNRPPTIASCHLERDTNGTGGAWRPVRQAREAVDVQCAWVNGEPIGIDSSGAADDDPSRIAMAAALTWACRGAAYTIHTGAGIRGGGHADLERGRRSNLWEQPQFDICLNAVLAVREVLPTDLPNWRWVNSNSRYPDFPFELPYDDRGTKILAPEDTVLRAFAALAGDGRFSCMPVGINGDFKLTARRTMAFDHRNAAGQLIARVELAAGQSYDVHRADGPAAILVGTFL